MRNMQAFSLETRSEVKTGTTSLSTAWLGVANGGTNNMSFISLDPPRMVGKISRIHLYPVKSCAGIELESASMNTRGLETVSRRPVRDREYVIVEAHPERNTVHHKALTQRDRGLQKMCLITPRIHGDKLKLGWNNQDMTDISDAPAGKELPVRVHRSFATGIDQGDEVAKLLSDYLSRPVRLVRASGRFSRMSAQDYVKNDNPLNWQDAYSVNWLFEESVVKVGELLGRDVPYLNFRPNIVCSGGSANLEHSFYHVEFDGVKGMQAKPCTRCMMTNVDWKSGTMPTTKPLPLSVIYDNFGWLDLNNQRQAIFAENFLPGTGGIVKRNGKVIASSLRDPPLLYGRSSEIKVSR